MIIKMFLNEILIITTIFIFLIFTAFRIGAPRAIIPLSFIYLFFLVFNKTIHQNNSFQNENISNIKEPDKGEFNKKSKLIEKKKTNKPVPINLSEKLLKPKPLTFSSKKKLNNYKLDSTNNYNKKENENIVNEDNLIKLKEIKICKNVENRQPVNIGNNFFSSVDSLYCFTKIENNGEKKEIRHVWYYKNEIKSQIKYNIKKSKEYRSWTKKRISSTQLGKWKVEIQKSDGKILGATEFLIR